MTPDELVTKMSLAIGKFEGFFLKKSLAKRNHNPGNLRSWGTTPVIGGFAVFPDEESGWKALRMQVMKNVFVRKLTFKEFFAGKPGVYAGYAPDSDGNKSTEYAEYVAEKVGAANADVVIKDLVTDEEDT